MSQQQIEWYFAARDGNKDAEHKFILSWQDLAKKLINQIINRHEDTSFTTFEDMLQVANLGIYQAIQAKNPFNPKKGKISTFIGACMKFSVLKFLRRERLRYVKNMFIPMVKNNEYGEKELSPYFIGLEFVTLPDYLKLEHVIKENKLTRRELFILRRLYKGMNQKEIAAEMGISRQRCNILIKPLREKLSYLLENE